MNNKNLEIDNLLKTADEAINIGKQHLEIQEYESAAKEFSRAFSQYIKARIRTEALQASVKAKELDNIINDYKRIIDIQLLAIDRKLYLSQYLEGEAMLADYEIMLLKKENRDKEQDELADDVNGIHKSNSMHVDEGDKLSKAEKLFKQALKLIEDNQNKSEKIIDEGDDKKLKRRLAKCMFLQNNEEKILEASRLLEELYNFKLKSVDTNTAQNICLDMGRIYLKLGRKQDALLAFMHSKYSYSLIIDNYSMIDKLISSTLSEIDLSQLRMQNHEQNHEIAIEVNEDDRPVVPAPDPYLIFYDPLLIRAGGLIVLGSFFYIRGFSHITVTMFSVNGFTALDCLAFTATGFLGEPWIMEVGRYAIENTPESIKSYVEDYKNKSISFLERN